MPGSATDEADVTVSPDTPLIDEEITIRASGIDPDDPLTIRVEMQWHDTTFESSATFQPTDEGSVSTAEAAPVSGAYEGVDPMGLFWAMEPTGGSADRTPVPAELPTTISLEQHDETVARTTLTRRTRASGVERREVDADGLPADLYLPASEGPHPGVVLLGGSDGGRPRGARPWLLASHGYAVLGVAYFGEAGTPTDHLVEVPIEAVERAVDWFSSQQSVQNAPLGVLGTSRGSELAFFLGSRLDAVEAVVGIVPSGIAFQALGENFQPEDTAAWAVDDEPVSYVPLAFSLRDSLSLAWSLLRGAPLRIRDAYIDGIEAASPDRLAAAEIPVEDTGGPLLLIAGEDDDLWASAAFARRLRDRLAEAGYDHPVECQCHPNAGHAIGVPYLPTTNRSTAGEGRITMSLGGSPAGYATADEDSWRAILDSFEGLKASDSK